MYTVQGQTRSPTIRIDSFSEKEKFSSPTESKDASISILPKTPLSLDDTTITTSRPGSPAPHKKRKNDSVGYFTKLHH